MVDPATRREQAVEPEKPCKSPGSRRADSNRGPLHYEYVAAVSAAFGEAGESAQEAGSDASPTPLVSAGLGGSGCPSVALAATLGRRARRGAVARRGAPNLCRRRRQSARRREGRGLPRQRAPRR